MPLYRHGKSGFAIDLHVTKGKAASKGITGNGYLSDAKDVKLMAAAPEGAKGRQPGELPMKQSGTQGIGQTMQPSSEKAQDGTAESMDLARRASAASSTLTNQR